MKEGSQITCSRPVQEVLCSGRVLQRVEVLCRATCIDCSDSLRVIPSVGNERWKSDSSSRLNLPRRTKQITKKMKMFGNFRVAFSAALFSPRVLLLLAIRLTPTSYHSLYHCEAPFDFSHQLQQSTFFTPLSFSTLQHLRGTAPTT